MSQLVRLEGKHTTQNAHCALVISKQSNILDGNYQKDNRVQKVQNSNDVAKILKILESIHLASNYFLAATLIPHEN